MHSDKWNHGWGFRDTQFEIGPDGHVRLTGNRYEISGFSMPGFLPFCEDALGVQLQRDDLMQTVPLEVSAPNKHPAFCAQVEMEFPTQDYSYEDRVRAVHSHGQATADEVYQALYGKLQRVVDMVFYCRSEASAVRITELAEQHGVCLIPYGGGTNVSGCLTLPSTETRMMVAINTRFLNKIEWINQTNGQACVQAGITGSDLEAQLRKLGFTSGHEPDSLELSTLGGWISTNASGMKRHRYGGIEEIVEHVTVVTPTGRLETLDMFPRQSTGVQVRPSLFGSEGNFGLITKAVLRLRRLPEATAYQSLIFPTFERGVGFLHALAGTSFIPASIRLVDNAQFRFGHALKPAETSSLAAAKSKLQRVFLEKVKGVDLSRMCVATLVMEGMHAEVEAQEQLIQQLAAQHQGFFAGSSNGKRGYNLTFAIAYIRDFLTRMHVMGETVETTAPWDKIQLICAAVRTEANKIHQEFNLPGKPFVSHRITQLYTTGVCIYFTYGIYTRGIKDADHVASSADQRLRAAIVEAGGAISNHHGIGKFRSAVLKQRLPSSNVRLIRAMKTTLDPNNVFGVQNGVFHEEVFKKDAT
jgi:alkyldihydroxyacetonephosphate synthase